MAGKIKILFVTESKLLYQKKCILDEGTTGIFDVESVSRLSAIGNCIAENTYDLMIIQNSGKKSSKIINMLLPTAYEYDIPIILFLEDINDEQVLDFIKMGVVDCLDIKKLDMDSIKRRCLIAVERNKVSARHINDLRIKYQDERKESIQSLTGGIAHQFNNLLAVIMGNLELLERDCWEDREAVDKINACNRSALRMSDITSQLLAYSAQSQFVANDALVNDIVNQLIPDVRKVLIPDIDLKMNVQSGKLAVKGDINQIELVVLNLIKNAAEAISNDEGVIELYVFQRNIDADQLESGWIYDQQIVTGEYICISVRDNGAGIDPSILDRVYDPFFTTKFTGRGLGLAAVKGIVFSHQGAVKIDTEVNKYTQVEVLLPCVQTRISEPLLPSQTHPFDHQKDRV